MEGIYPVGCYRDIATERYLLIKRPSDVMHWKDGNVLRFGGARQSCRTGAIQANGLMYGFPNVCYCINGTIRGFSAFAPAAKQHGKTGQSGKVNGKTYRLERGPAAGFTLKGKASDSEDWPTFRHDPSRSCSTTASVSPDFKLLWERKVNDQEKPRPHLFEEWKHNPLGGDHLTAPVAAEGMVFVGLVESHRLVALDAKDGKERWSYTAGGRLDAPPTIHRGLCFLGCRDGWVYCLRAEDGKLVWRFRAAPEDRRVVTFGQLTSTWPVVGGVLVDQGLAFFSAGRSSHVDGGIFLYALDPASGRVVWQKQPMKGKGVGKGYRGIANDLLVSDGQIISVGGTSEGQFELKSGKALRNRPIKSLRASDVRRDGYAPDSRLLDRSWMRNTRRILKNRILFQYAAGVRGQLVVFDKDRVFGFRHTMAYDKGPMQLAALKTEFKTTPDINHRRGYRFRKDTLWTLDATKLFQVEAMVLTDGVLFAAGPLDGKNPAKSRLRAIAAKDGRTLKEYNLDSGPVPDGMAAIDGKLFIATRKGSILCLGR